MDKKKPVVNDENDLKGFEEFIAELPGESHFLPRGVGGSPRKNEAGFDHFTFLTNDTARLTKLKTLLSEKLPFSAKYDQSDKLIEEQKEEIAILKKKLHECLDKTNSPFRKAMSEVFNNFFDPPKNSP